MNPGYVYMLCNDRKNVLYTGSARDLENRVRLHRSGLLPGFTKKYNVKRLVYFEVHPTVYIAAARESQIKGYTRAKKEALIAKENPEWRDLYDEAFGVCPVR